MCSPKGYTSCKECFYIDHCDNLNKCKHCNFNVCYDCTIFNSWTRNCNLNDICINCLDTFYIKYM
jgi:hypothetical protein